MWILPTVKTWQFGQVAVCKLLSMSINCENKRSSYLAMVQLLLKYCLIYVTSYIYFFMLCLDSVPLYSVQDQIHFSMQESNKSLTGKSEHAWLPTYPFTLRSAKIVSHSQDFWRILNVPSDYKCSNKATFTIAFTCKC